MLADLKYAWRADLLYRPAFSRRIARFAGGVMLLLGGRGASHWRGLCAAIWVVLALGGSREPSRSAEWTRASPHRSATWRPAITSSRPVSGHRQVFAAIGRASDPTPAGVAIPAMSSNFVAVRGGYVCRIHCLATQGRMASGTALENTMQRATDRGTLSTSHELDYLFSTARGRTFKDHEAVGAVKWDVTSEGPRGSRRRQGMASVGTAA